MQSSVLPAGTEVRGIVVHLNVKDPHPIWKNALKNGAKVVVELERQFWGDVYGSFRDPFGYEWGLCSSSPITAEPESPDEGKGKEVPEKWTAADHIPVTLCFWSNCLPLYHLTTYNILYVSHPLSITNAMEHLTWLIEQLTRSVTLAILWSWWLKSKWC